MIDADRQRLDTARREERARAERARAEAMALGELIARRPVRDVPERIFDLLEITLEEEEDALRSLRSLRG